MGVIRLGGRNILSDYFLRRVSFYFLSCLYASQWEQGVTTNDCLSG